jgi:FtsZ-interacting cell division protein ZipA
MSNVLKNINWKKLWNKLTFKNVTISIIVILLIVAAILFHALNNRSKQSIIPQGNNIVYVDSNKVYHNFNEDANFKDLKKKNKELYDSLKKYKNQIDYLVQFSYNKTYDTGKIVVKETEKKEDVALESKTYEYSNNKNDTINYKLQINSEKEPNWYRLKMNLSDKFTVVNKTNGNGQNETTIQSGNKGDINNVTVYNKKEKKSFWKRFAIGPAVTVGYDPINKHMGMAIGVGITFDLTK